MYLPTGAHVLDWLLNMILAVPIVLFRRGSIDLLFLYVKVDPPYNYLIIFLVGSLFVAFFYIYPFVHKKIENLPKAWQVFVTRIAITFGSVILLTYWRGIWGFADWTTDQYELKGALIGLFICHIIMAFLQTNTTLLFTPFFLSCDENPGILIPNPVFSQKMGPDLKGHILYFLDVCFTHFINNTLVILWFRHMFKVLVYLPFPQEYFGVICILTGIGISFLFLLCEVFCGRLLERISKMDKENYREGIQQNVVKLKNRLERGGSPSIESENETNYNTELSEDEFQPNPPIKRKVLRFFSLTFNEFIRYIYIEILSTIALFCLSVYWLGILEVMKLAFPDIYHRTWFCLLLGWLLLMCGNGLSSNGLAGCSHDLDLIYPRWKSHESPFIFNNPLARYFINVEKEKLDKIELKEFTPKNYENLYDNIEKREIVKSEV